MEILVKNAVFLFLLHMGAVYGFWLCLSRQILWQTFALGHIIGHLGGLGVTVGAHRLWSHRSYKANLPLRIILMILFTSAGQNSIYTWVRDHRVHHKYTDTDADPHNVHRGIFFSHMGWLLMKKHPQVIVKGKELNFSDLEDDPIVMFQKRYFMPLFLLVGFIIPVLIPVVIFNENIWNSIFIMFHLRYVGGLHSTWSVNSVAHVFGMRPYTSNIKPTENTFVSIVTMGEGWHNYHHTFPWDYRASELGMPYSFSTTVINFCEKIGWAKDLKAATPEMIYRRRMIQGDKNPQ